MHVIPALERQEDSCEFEASLDYLVSFANWPSYRETVYKSTYQSKVWWPVPTIAAFKR